MKDRLKRELEVGMLVALSPSTSSDIWIGRVKKLGKVKVTVEMVDNNFNPLKNWTTIKYPMDLLIIEK